MSVEEHDQQAPYSEEELRGYLQEYRATGRVVLKGVLSAPQVQLCRNQLHSQLAAQGVDWQRLSPEDMAALKRLQTHSSGGLPFYYSPWRLRHCALNARVYQVTRYLWQETYASGDKPGYEQPWGAFDPSRGYAFVDSMNFRLPSPRAEGSGQKPLRAHIDINPFDRYGGRKGRTRWRPFQGFISLTDSTGGFECIQDGFHLEFEEYFSKHSGEKQNGGLIQLWRHPEHASLVERISPVQYQPGDAVLWDWRLPHRVAEEHPGEEPREVVYTSFLPCLEEQNGAYARKQGGALKKCVDPPDFQRGNKEKPTIQVDRNELQEFLRGLSDEHQAMLGLKKW